MAAADELSQAQEIIPGRLYFCPLRRPEGLRLSHLAASCITYSIDNEPSYQHQPFFAEHGPLSLGKVFRFCRRTNELLQEGERTKKRVYYCCGPSNQAKGNAAALVGIYQVIYLNRSAEEAYKPLQAFKPYIPFRDASCGVSTFHLTIFDVIKGMQKARDVGFIDWNSGNSTWSVEEYEHYEQVENGDLNWIVPGKLLAFSGPAARGNEIAGYRLHTPEDYWDYYRKKNVTAIVRLNKKVYDRKRFTDGGFRHHDLYFPDGSCPSEAILLRFLEIAESEPGAMAVHCKAGLGRTGVLICCYIMKHFRFTAEEVIGYIRVCRPGSVIGPQQNFLREVEARMWHEGDVWRQMHGIAKPHLALTDLVINGRPIGSMDRMGHGGAVVGPNPLGPGVVGDSSIGHHSHASAAAASAAAASNGVSAVASSFASMSVSSGSGGASAGAAAGGGSRGMAAIMAAMGRGGRADSAHSMQDVSLMQYKSSASSSSSAAGSGSAASSYLGGLASAPSSPGAVGGGYGATTRTTPPAAPRYYGGSRSITPLRYAASASQGHGYGSVIASHPPAIGAATAAAVSSGGMRTPGGSSIMATARSMPAMPTMRSPSVDRLGSGGDHRSGLGLGGLGSASSLRATIHTDTLRHADRPKVLPERHTQSADIGLSATGSSLSAGGAAPGGGSWRLAAPPALNTALPATGINGAGGAGSPTGSSSGAPIATTPKASGAGQKPGAGVARTLAPNGQPRKVPIAMLPQYHATMSAPRFGNGVTGGADATAVITTAGGGSTAGMLVSPVGGGGGGPAATGMRSVSQLRYGLHSK